MWVAGPTSDLVKEALMTLRLHGRPAHLDLVSGFTQSGVLGTLLLTLF